MGQRYSLCVACGTFKLEEVAPGCFSLHSVTPRWEPAIFSPWQTLHPQPQPLQIFIRTSRISIKYFVTVNIWENADLLTDILKCVKGEIILFLESVSLHAMILFVRLTQIKEYVKVSSDHKGQVILANDTVRSPPRPSFHGLCLEELCLPPVISVFPV